MQGVAPGSEHGIDFVLVQREMESWCSQLASKPPSSAAVWRTPPIQVADGGTGSG
jgi:hypothetical protein